VRRDAAPAHNPTFTANRFAVVNFLARGRDQFELAHVDVATDPKLRPGDVVATGMVAFTRCKNKTADFTPAESYSRFSKSYRDRLAERIMPPNPGAPPVTPVKLLLSSAAQGHDRSASC
jgi:hypothetical protein